MIVLQISTNHPKDTEAVSSHLFDAFMSAGAFGLYTAKHSEDKTTYTSLMSASMDHARTTLTRYFEKLAPGVLSIEPLDTDKKAVKDHFEKDDMPTGWDRLYGQDVEGVLQIKPREPA